MPENISAEDFDAGVIVTCVEDKYIGYLLGSDDIYLYMRYTHKVKDVWPVATAESIAGVKEILMKMSLWRLRFDAARKFKINPMKKTKEELAGLLAEELIEQVITDNGPVETYIAQPHAVKLALSHEEVLRFESLTDVTTSAILSGLDFAVGSEYNEEHDTDPSTKSIPPEDRKR